MPRVALLLVVAALAGGRGGCTAAERALGGARALASLRGGRAGAYRLDSMLRLRGGGRNEESSVRRERRAPPHVCARGAGSGAQARAFAQRCRSASRCRPARVHTCAVRVARRAVACRDVSTDSRAPRRGAGGRRMTWSSSSPISGTCAHHGDLTAVQLLSCPRRRPAPRPHAQLDADPVCIPGASAASPSPPPARPCPLVASRPRPLPVPHPHMQW